VHPSKRTDDLPVPSGRRVAERLFQTHALVYVLVNAMLVAIWAAAGAGYFWPIWPIITWGPAVVLQGYFTYGRPPA
jgi:hypothetical protein